MSISSSWEHCPGVVILSYYLYESTYFYSDSLLYGNRFYKLRLTLRIDHGVSRNIIGPGRWMKIVVASHFIIDLSEVTHVFP
jgi:hypothetical protein